MLDHLTEARKIVMRAKPFKTETGIPRVFMVKGKVPEHELSGMYEPMINLVLQGSKTLTIGSQILKYNPTNYFVMSIDVPASGALHQGKHGEPYLSVNLYIDPEILSEVIDHSKEAPDLKAKRAFSVCTMTDELFDAWLRMLRLMDRPEEISALAPIYEREILFRVLQGPHGWLLRGIANRNSAISKMRASIKWIKNHFSENLKIDFVASKVGMSVTSFHRHFKSVTGMSPLQYQKQMRLLEARRLMIQDQMNVTEAAFKVGYESTSQFSREYSRHFGNSPLKDIDRIRSSIESSLI
jgi:AraC-like DNA-binding protein